MKRPEIGQPEIGLPNAEVAKVSQKSQRKFLKVSSGCSFAASAQRLYFFCVRLSDPVPGSVSP
ncbi:hypothetical protein [Variovorax sp. dw_308]|uniref:hypothetical protein n=1 Tax=Variovorax sp. dw_308 TaxID=2721546 RepID=UPI001C446692|nr:hypothetical protein [Variovorax sp. dw_308]